MPQKKVETTRAFMTVIRVLTSPLGLAADFLAFGIPHVKKPQSKQKGGEAIPRPDYLLRAATPFNATAKPTRPPRR